jgi:uncharacterized LabA/DUF88 family protein
MKRVAIFIDGNNFYFELKKIYSDDTEFTDFNFEKFCNFLAENNELVAIFYYNAPLDRTKNSIKYQNQQKFFGKIRKIPKLNLILCKLLKRRIKGTEKYYYVLKEDDIYMAVDLVKGAFKNIYDKAILVSGDGDFVPAVLAAKEEGKFIENVYFKKSASTNLKTNCNRSFELKKEFLDRFFESYKPKLDER